jgi:alpha-L-fucosidase
MRRGRREIVAMRYKAMWSTAPAFLLLASLTAAEGAEAPKPAPAVDPRLQWFVDAKLGIFIHWGIYSVAGIPESWSFYNGDISYTDYMKQQAGFTATRYDPQAWAALFKKAGARYAVLTSKHHDGFALWDSKLSTLDVMLSPAKRDLIGPYCTALRSLGLKVGLYFSHLDWSHPDYPSLRGPGMAPSAYGNPYSHAAPGKENPEAWKRFLAFHRGQLREIGELFRPDLYWFDGDWDRSEEQWDMKGLRREILSRQPDTILNARMRGQGDYETPEQGVPILPPAPPWEFCMTMNDSWGYQPRDTNYKSTTQIIRTFAEVVGMGGNLLLDIGPKADGSIDSPQVERLESLGRWTGKHAEAIWGTTAGLPFGHFYGPTTLSKDQKTVFLFVFDTPKAPLAVRGIRNKIARAWVVGTTQDLKTTRSGGAAWNKIPGVTSIDVPAAALDPEVTVIGLTLEGALDLYRGAGGAIEAN